jgi:hypothetical protein
MFFGDQKVKELIDIYLVKEKRVIKRVKKELGDIDESFGVDING